MKNIFLILSLLMIFSCNENNYQPEVPKEINKTERFYYREYDTTFIQNARFYVFNQHNGKTICSMLYESNNTILIIFHDGSKLKIYGYKGLDVLYDQRVPDL